MKYINYLANNRFNMKYINYLANNQVEYEIYKLSSKQQD